MAPAGRLAAGAAKGSRAPRRHALLARHGEGPRSENELKKVGKAFKGEHLATSILENGGKTPWMPPEAFGDMGYTMLLYPTTMLFRATYALRKAASDLRAGKPLDKEQAVDMDEFLTIVELRHWQEIEKRLQP